MIRRVRSPRKDARGLRVASGLLLWRAVDDELSATLRAVLVGNALLQLGLLPVELLAWRAGVISQVSGIVPNSVLHLLLAGGFAWFALRMHTTLRATGKT